MGKGKPRAAEKGVLGQNSQNTSCSSTYGSHTSVPLAPVFYPTEEEFKNPLEFLRKIRPEAEPFGICRIVPPKSWNPPFALDRDSFTFPTKSQAIHRLQVRPASCDPKTFELEYSRFLESHSGRKPKKRVVFEGEELDMCGLFNAVKRYGGYEKVCKGKKWGDVYRIVRTAGKITECLKHVLSQLYCEHLYDYEEYQRLLDQKTKKCKRGRILQEKKNWWVPAGSERKRRRRISGVGSVKKVIIEESDQICEQCKSGLHGEAMLLCDRCDKGWHLYCLSPPMEHVPSGNWYCLDCVSSGKDSFGFVPGKRYSLEAFRRLDDRSKRKWLGPARATWSQIEKQFWDIVEGKSGEVEVMYGSDLDTSVHGSGFPRADDPIPSSVEPELWKECSSSPWNLNNLPKLQGSMLRAVPDNIAGVMVPWLYIGMLFSSFCWHVEDHCFYSMNYLHWGEPKCWYGIPGNEAHAFEQVMRNTLPDLFDAQPDLLFQLVTMLNPSVLQENGVPVYGVLQEPGNFVVTFPRSFHGGFNFGLNCAEAVNFAPADWLPHGGYGAEMYKLYHKPAVLCHEELLCVVAKTVCDTEVLPYVKKEMHRIFTKEKACREEIWRNGIFKSSTFPPRKHPEYVGTEEDPTCIICQQYLYLSAISCSCRPSAFVCLEHWKHLCECNPSKHRLLYRHTLAVLNDLAHMDSSLSSNATSFEGMSCHTHCQLQCSCPIKSNAVTRKTKGGHMTLTQLAEDWLLKTSSVFESQFSEDVFANALKAAEQFLWADHEMDLVRDMASKLVVAQNWALNLRACILKADSYLHFREKDVEKVSLREVENLLIFDPLPCNEPGYSKLKAYAEDAKLLIIETKSALLSCLNVTIGELESLYSKVSKFPIHLAESEELERKISSAKVWLASARECLDKKMPDSIEIDILHKLKSEILELRVQFPEFELLSDMTREAESWQIRCRDVLEGPLKLKELENFLHSAAGVTISIPELKCLRQYHSEACSWTNNLHNFLQNIKRREDHRNIVKELSCMLKAGVLLKVQVDELPLVEAELKKSHCREKGFETLAIQRPLEFANQLMTEAVSLQIDDEKVFNEISEILSAATSWEERAKDALGCAAQVSELEDMIRSSKNIFIVLPSLADVNDAVSAANSWIRRSQPFLASKACSVGALDSMLKVDNLKELVAESKHLKVSLEGPERLRQLLMDVENWQHDACSLLDQSMSFLYGNDTDIRFDSELLKTIEELLFRIDATTNVGLYLAFDFCEVKKLQHARLTLEWCLKVVSFYLRVPLLEEVDSMIECMQHLPAIFSSFSLGRMLIDGARWLKKALAAMKPHDSRRCRLEDAEEVLDEAERTGVQFAVVVAQLQNAIDKHKLWAKQAREFFQSKSDEQHWLLLSKIRELAESDAFCSPELDMVVLEAEKVKEWIQRCVEIVKPSVDDLSSLTDVLVKIKGSMDRALCIYHSSNGSRTRAFCVCCPGYAETEEVFTCLTCMDRYHFSCVGPPFATAGMTNEYACPFCLCMESGTICRNGGRPLICRGKRPELKSFVELLAVAKDFYVGVEEKDLVQEIVKQALECKSYLLEIVNHTLAHIDEELSSVSDSLSNALKSTAVSGIYDHEASCKLELALMRNSWKIRVKKLLKCSRKPVIQQILLILKEGTAKNMSSEDYFMHELTQVKDISLQWADLAKKVASDSGSVELSEVFRLISDGENLPVYFEKEIKLLRSRSVLYCICRKPYDHRAMIACDQCDEWYHFDCINLQKPPPKTFFCPACKPPNGELISLAPSLVHNEREIIDGQPQTPSPQHNESKKTRTRKVRSSLQHKMKDAAGLNDRLRCYGKIDHLWRLSRKPFRRTARRRSQFQSLFIVPHSQQ